MPTDSTTTLANLVRADADRNLSYRGLQRRAQASDIPKLLVDLRFLPVLLVRLSSVRGPVALIATLVNRLLFGVEVARQTKIGPGLYFPHTGGIVIGASRIGADATIYHGVTLGAKTVDFAFTPAQRPALGDGVVIAAGAKVLGGIHIADRATVAANAVVVHDVASGDTVGGVPASVLKRALVHE